MAGNPLYFGNMAGNSNVETLLLLVKKSAHEVEILVPLNELAKDLKSSKQTAARRLESLENSGLISRRYGTKGQTVMITSQGIAELRAIYLDLENVFKRKISKLKFSGKVTAGFGEGRYYMQQRGYAEKFKEVLGYAPYAGTLDVKLEKNSIEKREILLRMQGLEISGYKTRERTFGPVKIFNARLNGVKGALVLPNRSHHRDVLEFIAAQNLRKTLRLKDGDQVEIEVEV